MKLLKDFRDERTGDLLTIFKKENGCSCKLSLTKKKDRVIITLESEYSSLQSMSKAFFNRTSAVQTYHKLKKGMVNV